VALYHCAQIRAAGEQCLYCSEEISTLLLSCRLNCCSAIPSLCGGRCRVGKFLQIIIQAVAYIGSLAGLCVLLLLNKPKATPFALHKYFKDPLRRTQLQIEVSSSRVTGVCSMCLYFIVLINKTYIFPSLNFCSK
jgi:hypothetical protein